MWTEGDGNRGPLRDALLGDLVRRQPVLAAINIVTALLFTSGFVNSARTPVPAAWFGYMALSQAARLLCWRYLRDRPAAREAGVWLVGTSALVGVGWGAIGILFDSVGSAAQQMLVPFFLAGMAAGSVVSYQIRLISSAEPALATSGSWCADGSCFPLIGQSTRSCTLQQGSAKSL